MPKQSRKRPSRTLYRDTHLITIYQLAKSGATDDAIAQALGVDAMTIRNWKREHPAVKDALKRGRSGSNARTNEETFKDFAYGHLPDDLRALWEKIMLAPEEPNPTRYLELLLEKQGKISRQRLFIHALIHSNFIQSKALRILGYHRSTVSQWIEAEPEFGEMLREMETLKDDFFEEAFLDLVQRRDSPAVIYAAKTKLRKRGYGDKVELKIDAPISPTTPHAVPLAALSLSARKEILANLRSQGIDPAKSGPTGVSGQSQEDES
jgi:hypothetical protein